MVNEYSIRIHKNIYYKYINIHVVVKTIKRVLLAKAQHRRQQCAFGWVYRSLYTWYINDSSFSMGLMTSARLLDLSNAMWRHDVILWRQMMSWHHTVMSQGITSEAQQATLEWVMIVVIYKCPRKCSGKNQKQQKTCVIMSDNNRRREQSSLSPNYRKSYGISKYQYSSC